MKNLVLLLVICLPFLARGEYNGLHLTFKIQFFNGEEVIGYKYYAHGQKSEAFKKELESNPDILLRNSFANEPGEFGYYLNRLEYNYQQSSVYKLLNPRGIDLSEIKALSIKDMIMSSYAIQISSDHIWEDRLWMDTKALCQYSTGENLCSHDTFIHQSGVVPEEVLKQIKTIIQRTDEMIVTKEKELVGTIDSDEEYSQKMKRIYEERNRLLSKIFKQYSNLKAVTISLCTC